MSKAATSKSSHDFAEGQYERFPDLLAELIRLNLDVIAVTGAVTARAAKKAVKDVPIVFAVVVDPVADNVVPNLERPGGNLTGTTSFDPQQAKKQLDLLKEAIPGLRRVALLGDQGVSEALIKASEAEAQAMGIQNSTAPSGSAESGPGRSVRCIQARARRCSADTRRTGSRGSCKKDRRAGSQGSASHHLCTVPGRRWGPPRLRNEPSRGNPPHGGVRRQSLEGS